MTSEAPLHLGVNVVVPTHRAQVSWTPAAGRWAVRLDRVTFHRDELITESVHDREPA
jgi:hypothetical protein